jgi:hypothetical protein
VQEAAREAGRTAAAAAREGFEQARESLELTASSDGSGSYSWIFVAAIAVVIAVCCIALVSCVGCAVAGGGLAWMVAYARRVSKYRAGIQIPDLHHDDPARAQRLCDLDDLAKQALGSDASAARWAAARLDVTVSDVQSWAEAWARLQKGPTRAQPRFA